MADAAEPDYPFAFVTRRPGAPLCRFVESVWYARGTVPYAREKIAPTGSTVAVIVLGDPILETPDNGAGEPLRTDRGFLTGPHLRPTINEPIGETFAVGIVTTPIGCSATFACSPAGLRGRVVELETAWPRARALREELIKRSSAAEMLELVERTLSESCNSEIVGLDRCETAVSLLEANPLMPIAEVADGIGVSHGHLDHEFTRVVGLSPRALARILRLRRLLASIDVQSEIVWADLAAANGWFDQAHLIRDFKRHTGVTPSQYIDAQRATFSPIDGSAAAGFVPEY